jgi:outer membrane protein assembly factor BamB
MGGLLIYKLEHQRPPGQVVLDGFAALKQVDLEGLKKCFSEPAWEVVSASLPSADDEQARERLRQHMATVRDVRIETTNSLGYGVEVTVVIAREAGSEREAFHLVRTHGAWRMAATWSGAATAPRIPATPQDVERYFDTPHASVTHGWINRTILESVHPDQTSLRPYMLLAGNLEDLAPHALDDLSAADADELIKESIFRMAWALLDRPDTVTKELARGLVAEGLRGQQANDRLYRKWRAGIPLTEREKIAYVGRAGGSAKIALGRKLAADARALPNVPGGWEETRSKVIQEIAGLERNSARYDALGLFMQVRPLLEVARAALGHYPPFHNHSQQLDALHAEVWNTIESASTELQAALVMAPGANMRRTGVYRTEGVRRFNKVLWKYEAGDRVGGQPAIRNETLYFATSARYRWDPSYVYAVDPHSRETKWRFDAPARRCSSLTLAGNGLYLSCGDEGSSASYLCAIDTATGRQLWVFEGPRGVDNSLSHPAVDDANVYVADCWGALYALDGKTGQKRWTFQGKEGQTNTPPTPSLANGVVYLPGTNNVYAIDADTGAEKWRLDATVTDSIVAVDRGMMYFYHRGISAVSLSDRKLRWRFEPADRVGSMRGCPAVDGDVVYARDGRIVYALEADTGELIWRLDVGRPIDWKVSPVVADDILYIGSGAAPNEEGESCLHAIDTGTGRELWRFPVDTVQYGAAPVVAAGVVYFASAELVYAVH